jgi:hypothetical protein
MIDTLTPGRVYGFKVQARNKFGLSVLSEEFSILCATVPDAGPAPSTTSIGSDVTIAWNAPYDSGSPVTGYVVYIRSISGTFIEESTYCVNDQNLVDARECTLPLALLTFDPWSLSLGDSVYAKIMAQNFYGDGM